MRVVILGLAVLCGCTQPAPEPAREAEDPTIVLSGFTISTPADTAWKQVATDDS